MESPYDLERFVTAQQGIYPTALAELQAGEKKSHWMWYVFPQMAGLGSSAMAYRYGIGSLEEACSYLRHPVLGPRLDECLEAVDRHAGKSAGQIFGSLDAMKFRSSLTLFALAGSDRCRAMLARWFRGEADERTLELLDA